MAIAVVSCYCFIIVQGSYGSWKTWKVLEFYSGIFQDFLVLEKGHWSWKGLEICLTQQKNKCMEGCKEKDGRRINIKILGL